MNLKNNILTNVVDLSGVFISKPPLDFISNVTSLYQIKYSSSDFPLNSISLPNLTTLTKVNDLSSNGCISIGTTNTVKKYLFPSLVNVYDSIRISAQITTEEIDFSGLTHSNFDIIPGYPEMLKLSIFNLNSLIDCNNLSIPQTGSMSSISLPNLKKANSFYIRRRF